MNPCFTKHSPMELSMTTKPKTATHRAKSPLSEFYATATPEQKRAVYMKALSEAKAEQDEVSRRAQMIRASM